MSYNVITDPSGALLQDINAIIYKNTSVAFIPAYDETYQLRNSVGKVVADIFFPFVISSEFKTPQPYLARDASNNIYVTKSGGYLAGDSATKSVAKLVGNAFIDLNFIIPIDPLLGAFFPRGIAFDSSGILYITTSTQYTPPFTSPIIHSKVFKVKFTDTTTDITLFNISGVSFIDLRGLDFDSSGNLYIADRLSNSIIKIAMVDYNNGIGTFFLTNSAGLNEPLDIKLDQYNNAYIANSLANNIIKVGPSNNISIFVEGLNFPTEITYNITDSTIYVANFGYSVDPLATTYINKIVNGYITDIAEEHLPYGIVVTTTGNVYYTIEVGGFLALRELGEITFINTTTNYANTFTGLTNATTYSISPITSVAFNNGFLYASQYNFTPNSGDLNFNGGGQIWKINDFDPSHNPILFYPLVSSSVAVNSSNELYVLYSVNNQLSFVDSGTNIATAVSITGAQLNVPMCMVFDGTDNLYISNSANNTICKLTFTDATNATSINFTITGEALNQPFGLVFDTAYTNLYIANNGNDVILKVLISTSVAIIYNTGGGQPPFSPQYIAFDSSGFLYVTFQGSIAVINPAGESFLVIGYGFSIQAGPITFDNLGILYVAQNDITSVDYLYKLTFSNFFTASSAVVTITGSPLSYITGLAFDTTFNELYLSNPIYNNILEVSIPANTASIYSVYNGEVLNTPSSIAFDNSYNYLYVTSVTNNNLLVINSIGTSIVVDISNNQLNAPSAIVFDGSYNLYIANSISNTICKLTNLTANFTTLTASATSTNYVITESPILFPAGLSFDASFLNLYISNPGYQNILKVSINTGVASIYNLDGVSIISPSGLYFDDNSGILYVSDLNTNKIIQITNNNYASNVDIIAGTSSVGGTSHTITINQPMGLTVDNSANLYISNYGNQIDAIVKLNFDTSNNIIVTTNGIDKPYDVAMKTSTEDMFIANYGSSFITQLNNNDELSIYVNVSSNGGSSITWDSSTNTLYELFDGGVIKSIDSNLVVSIFNVSGVSIPTFSTWIRFQPPNLLYIAGSFANNIYKIVINSTTSGTSSVLNITDYPTSFQPQMFAFDSSGNMYMISNIGNTAYNKYVYKIELPTPTPPNQASLYVDLGAIGNSELRSIEGIAFDSNNFMYSIVNSRFNSSTPRYNQLYRTTSGSTQTTELVYTFPDNVVIISINYIPWEDALIFTDANTYLYKVYLSYPFTNMSGELGPYDNTLFIFDVTNGVNLFDVSFNVYTPYIVIDPSNIAPNVPTNTTFHFITPYVVPYPTDSYILQCNGTNISNVFCNNCTYNKQKFLAGTYPTGLVYSTDTDYLYVALQNNTISRISLLGVVENDYFPPDLGLVGPTSLVLDSNYDMFVLNAGSDFISFLTLENNIISINNSFFTGILRPICLTYDTESNLLYLLSGIVPNLRITEINASDGSDFTILPIAFGALYDSNGLTIDAYNGLFAPTNVNQPPNTKYLYLSNTDQNGVHGILRVNLTDGLYTITSLVAGLSYQPFTMTNKNDGYLYVANKTGNTLSKISITGIDPNIQPWAVNGIAVPADLCFDGSGNLYVANSGTGPRNSRISKIYVDEFFFTNVILANGTCDNTQIFDITTQSCVEVDYYPPPSNPCSFPIPIPFPIGS